MPNYKFIKHFDFNMFKLAIITNYEFKALKKTFSLELIKLTSFQDKEDILKSNTIAYLFSSLPSILVLYYCRFISILLLLYKAN